MRFVRRKLYRAFPEFDEYSDDECELFLEQMRGRSDFDVPTAMAILIGVALFAALFLLGYLRLAHNILEVATPDREYISQARNVLLFIIAVALLAVPLFLCLWLSFLTRDLVLRRAVRNFLNRTICPGCNYSLLGQQVFDENNLRCPECGRLTTLNELGLTSADQLLPPGVNPRTPIT